MKDVLRSLGRRMQSDHGSAMLEFTVLCVAVIVPLVYAALAVMQVQAAAYAVTAAAREAGRALASTDGPAAIERAEVAVRIALADQGIVAPDALRVSCPGCWRRGGRTVVTVAVDVPLPMVPQGWGPISRMPVRADHLVTADRLGTQ